MGLFSNKESQLSADLQDKIDILTARNKRLENALKELKNKYDALTKLKEPQQENSSSQKKLTSTEIDTLFQAIKHSAFDKDKKRYFRSMLMLIKSNYNHSIYTYLTNELKTQ